MIYMSCPNCKNEYTIIPVKFKPGAFMCRECGWEGEGYPQWGKWFDGRVWKSFSDELALWLHKRAFCYEGFPIDALKGYVALKDDVLLCKGERPVGGIIVEYRGRHTKGNSSCIPPWLECDSIGKPRSTGTYFNAWLHNEHRDAVYVVDNPIVGFRIMETWWRAERRLPDVCWTSNVVPAKVRMPERVFTGRHILCVGSERLVRALKKRRVKADAWMQVTGRRLPDDLYISLRKLEDLANDPGNLNNTVQLPVAIGLQPSEPGSFSFLKHSYSRPLVQVQEMRGKIACGAGILRTLPEPEKCPAGKKSPRKRGNKAGNAA